MNRTEAKLFHALTHDKTYGCLNRQGLELVEWPKMKANARWIIFADIDDIHKMNAELGYHEVDRKIRNALKVRSTDLMATGRWYSGDEIVWVISRGDPEGLAKRLKAALQKQGLSATFAVVPVKSKKLTVNVGHAAELVRKAKNSNQKGSVQR